jgi:ribokinase
MNKIMVIGSSNMDLIMNVPYLPSPGETVGNGSFYQKYGGKGANQAVASVRAGGEVSVVSALGNDSFGQEMLDNFINEGINVSSIKRVNGPSGIALINVSIDTGENSITVSPGANGLLFPKDIELLDSEISKQDIIVIQNEIPIQTIEKIIYIAFQKGVKILYNPAPIAPIDVQLLNMVSILVVNETEAKSIFDIDAIDLEQTDNLISFLSVFTIDQIIITLGERGALICDSGIIEHYPAYKVKAVDTTGAGDTFCGYLATMISQGKSIPYSIKYAIAASALSIQSIGAQESIPKIAQVESLIH